MCVLYSIHFGIPKIAENETENERAENFCLGFIINDIVFARSRALMFLSDVKIDTRTPYDRKVIDIYIFPLRF